MAWVGFYDATVGWFKRTEGTEGTERTEGTEGGGASRLGRVGFSARKDGVY
jgi:hypothetical protein